MASEPAQSVQPLDRAARWITAAASLVGVLQEGSAMAAANARVEQ